MEVDEGTGTPSRVLGPQSWVFLAGTTVKNVGIMS